jgi:hypothetical protein
VIQEVIARRNRIEDLPHGLRGAGFVGCSLRLGSGGGHSALRPDVQLKYKAVTLRGAPEQVLSSNRIPSWAKARLILLQYRHVYCIRHK